MSTVQLRATLPTVDAVVTLLPTGSELPDAVPWAAFGFTGETGDVAVVPSGDAQVTAWVATAAEPTAEQQRRAVAKGLRAVPKATRIGIDPSRLPEADLAAIAEAAVLTTYTYLDYKGAEARDKTTVVDTVTILSPDARKAATKRLVEEAVVVAEATCVARDWVNTPPGDLRPPAFADAIKAAAPAGVRVTIWDEKRLAKENCGGILGVGAGSDAPPRLVRLTYNPEGATKHLALVGKGITFDSGGLSLKPGASMMTMKCDMGGAAAIVAATNAIARLGLPIRVTAYACIAENLPSGTATRPGDVLRMRSGATVEVHNTDAEGRLVLADGLALAVESEPDHVIDVATLTGAAMVALGLRTTAVLGNDDDLQERVLAAADLAGEPMWRLPITEEIGAAVTTSAIADLRQHNPKPYGGTLFAAAFLRAFVGEASWAHLDIAGPGYNDGGAYDYTPGGGTGAGVRTLVRLARDLG
ncbi:leucyl aminopeptidase [Aeromicrobium duanguangcaii]|uniref:Probable cytosol aminopeptidase n=1 Tax=Aeromicrobium duanguangcaii TaxID=2968086 RepID=A0ABY5KH14_9ACTN|nr:leucyl aminopeptidase [Aeromicrobium duanguangcaii]MCD9153306.1 leucyl aminopeptidase [Aeromicrobium duanguangcaii]UUI69599.1 leucyl aminopeptidase [Aeromicrobium duanguangcaii]